MRHSSKKLVFLILFLVINNAECTIESNDAFCEKFQKEDIVCFDGRTLGACLKFENSWVGVEIAVCNATYNLCCDANVIGCRVNGDCYAVTAAPPGIECSEGQLKEHPNNCRYFYSCSGGAWRLNQCAEGHKFNLKLGICTPGIC